MRGVAQVPRGNNAAEDSLSQPFIDCICIKLEITCSLMESHRLRNLGC